MSHPLIIILLGPPGCGKGTQSTTLCKKLKIPHISTGNLLREEIRIASPLGQKAKKAIDAGKLVDDPLIMDILKKRIQETDCAHGYLLDGFPRTVPQAKMYEELLPSPRDFYPIYLELDDKTITERLTGRLICSDCSEPYHEVSSPPKRPLICDRCEGPLKKRADDAPEVVTKRLQVYHSQTAPLIAFYQTRGLHTIHCKDLTKEQITEKLLMLLGSSKDE